jgi:hypothetical protein
VYTISVETIAEILLQRRGILYMVYYSLYNSDAADAVGPPDMEPCLGCVKVMKMRPEARSTTTSISEARNRTRRRGTGPQALRCHAGGAYLEAVDRGERMLSGTMTSFAGLTGALQPTAHAQRTAEQGSAPFSPSFPRACTA